MRVSTQSGEAQHGTVGPSDLRLLARAREWDEEPARFDQLMKTLAGSGPVEQAPRERFDEIMDFLFGWGFRDPDLPEVMPDYLAFLDAYRRALGVDEAAFAAILAEHGGVERAEQLSGSSFVQVVGFLAGNDVAWSPWPVPARNWMDRRAVGIINLAVYRLNLSFPEHVAVLAGAGGGCISTVELDQRGSRRVLAHYMALGYQPPGPAPRVAGEPGYITQPQANLIWKLWHDFMPSDAELSEVTLALWLLDQLGHEGGLNSLTARGTRRVLDYMLAPMIDLRRKAVDMLASGEVHIAGAAQAQDRR